MFRVCVDAETVNTCAKKLTLNAEPLNVWLPDIVIFQGAVIRLEVLPYEKGGPF